MEWVSFIELIAIPIIGYIMYQLSKVKQSVEDHKLHVAEKYVLKEDAEKVENKIYDVLKTMNSKLDRLIERKIDESK